jgi:hypothetical protein
MKIMIPAVVVATAGMTAAGLLGVAWAETPPVTPTPGTFPQRTVGVQGVASEQLPSDASTATATSVYREAMAAAIVDGQSKAQFLAEKTSATLGAIQNVTEGGGYIECEGEVEYTGGQPDFGSVTSYGVAAPLNRSVAAGGAVPGKVKGKVKRKKKVHKQGTAKQATSGTCMLSTQVSLVYALS